jgi:hypothetical protein
VVLNRWRASPPHSVEVPPGHFKNGTKLVATSWHKTVRV